VPSVVQRNEVGEIARAIEVFRKSLIELDRHLSGRSSNFRSSLSLGFIDGTLLSPVNYMGS
jgi:hypothetical protein